MLRSLRQRFVLVIGLPGQQHPQRVDAERRTEWDVQQRDETHDQRDRTCPILALQQTPTREETCRGFCQQQPSDDTEQGPQPDRDFRRWATIGNMKRVAEDDLRDNDQGNSSNRVQRRVRHPQNAHQPHMFANAAAPQLDESQHRLAAASATLLSRLQLRTTLIAKHLLPLRPHTLCQCIVRTQAFTSSETSSQFPVLSRLKPGSRLLRTENRELRTHQTASKNEKATRQLGRPFLSRENSSNGGLIHQNFLRESYEP